MKRVTTILWDNDGVLVDTEHLYYRANQDVLSEAGLAITMEEYVDALLVQARGVWHLFEDAGFDAADIDRIKKRRNDIYSRYLETEPLVVDGVRDVLDRLHERFRMAVVTSSRRDHFEIIHRRTGLLPYFDFTIASEDVQRPKPDPEPYVAALTRAGAGPAEAVVVEDSERGLRAALAAGVPCFVVPTVLTRQSDFSGAAAILDGLHELPARLLEQRT